MANDRIELYKKIAKERGMDPWDVSKVWHDSVTAVVWKKGQEPRTLEQMETVINWILDQKKDSVKETL